MANWEPGRIDGSLAASLERGLNLAGSLNQRRALTPHVLAGVAEDPRVIRVWRSLGRDVDACGQSLRDLASNSEACWGALPANVAYAPAVVDQINSVAAETGAQLGIVRFLEAVLAKKVDLRAEEHAEIARIFDEETLKRLAVRDSGSVSPDERSALTGGASRPSGLLMRFAQKMTPGSFGIDCLPIPAVQTALRRSLTRQYRRNLVLVGGSGVGKTAQVAAYVDEGGIGGRSPTVWRVPCGEFVGGFSGQKDLVAALQSMIHEAGSEAGTVLFLDDAHALGRSAGAGGVGVMAAIKETLADDRTRLWAATTAEGYERYIAEDETIGNLFSVVEVEEPGEEACYEVMNRHAGRIEKGVGVRFDPGVWPVVYSLCRRFLPAESFPAKMLHVADAAAHEALGDDEQTEPVATQSHVQQAVSQLAKVPINTLTEYEQERLRGLEDFLNDRVFSQEPATSAVTRAVRMLRLGLKNTKRTGGAFLFVGPPGTGKTELAKVLAEFLGGGEDKLVRFNMSEFQTPESYQRLIGPPPGYVGYEAGGELTNALRDNPYSIVLFDEIEKGSSRVFDLFLQVLSDGHLTDNKGRVVDCKNSVFVMTSNAVAETRGKSVDDLRAELKSYHDPFKHANAGPTFRPEFLDRLEVIPFGHLDRSTLRAIADREISQILSQASSGGILDCSISIHSNTLEWLLDQILEAEGGARSIQRVVESRVARFIAERFLDGTLQKGMSYEVRLGDDTEFVVQPAPAE